MTVLFKTACGCSKIVEWHGEPSETIRVALMPRLTTRIDLGDPSRMAKHRISSREFRLVGWRSPHCMEYEEVYDGN